MALFFVTGLVITVVVMLGVVKALICLIFPVIRYVVWVLIVVGWLDLYMQCFGLVLLVWSQ
jgi:hypothetical protein